MRVLLVTDWPALEAGTERCVERLRQGLAGAGEDVRLLTSSAGSAAGRTADYVAYGTHRPSQQALLQDKGCRYLCANPHRRQWTMRRAVQVNRSSSNAGCASLARGNLTDKLFLLAKQMFEVPSSRMHLTSLHLL